MWRRSQVDLEATVSAIFKKYKIMKMRLTARHLWFVMESYGKLTNSVLLEENSSWIINIRIAAALFLLFRKERAGSCFLLWIFGIFLNLHWARHHIADELMWIPVFTAGISWLWLVIETKRLWPSIVCHAIANLSIYLLIKTYRFLY